MAKFITKAAANLKAGNPKEPAEGQTEESDEKPDKQWYKKAEEKG